MAPSLLLAWRDLRRHPGRHLACLAALTLAGSLALVGMGTEVRYTGEQDRILDQTGVHFLAYLPERRASAGGFVADGVPTATFDASLADQVAAHPALVTAAAAYGLYRIPDPGGPGIDLGGLAPGDDQAVGTTCCAPSDLTAGRFLLPTVTGEVLAEASWARARGLEPGRSVRLGTRDFRISGTVNPGVRPGRAALYLGRDDFLTVVRRWEPGLPAGTANLLLVQPSSATRQDDAIRLVKTLLPGAVVVSYACYRPTAATVRANGLRLSLVEGIVGWATVLLAGRARWVAVHHRRHDLAVLRTLGWTSGQLARPLAVEALLLSLAAWALSLAVLGLWSLVSATEGPPVLPVGLALVLAGQAANLPALVRVLLHPPRPVQEVS